MKAYIINDLSSGTITPPVFESPYNQQYDWRYKSAGWHCGCMLARGLSIIMLLRWRKPDKKQVDFMDISLI